MLTRRQLLKYGAVGGALLAVPGAALPRRARAALPLDPATPSMFTEPLPHLLVVGSTAVFPGSGDTLAMSLRQGTHASTR